MLYAELTTTLPDGLPAIRPETIRVGVKAIAILPLFHVYGMNGVMNLGVYLAATLILVPRLDIKMLIEAIRKQQPTFFLGVPAIYVAVNSYPGIEYVSRRRAPSMCGNEGLSEHPFCRQ